MDGLLSQGKANGSQDRRRNLGLLSKCTTEIRSGLFMGMEIWGRQLTTRGVEIGVPNRGHFGCSK